MATPLALLLDPRRAQLVLLPAAVLFLQSGGQPHDLAAIERRDLPTHGENAVALRLGQIELHYAREGAHEGRMAAALVPEPESGGGLGPGQVEAGGDGLEPRQ